ncbi:MAG: DUF362 domain-containing protein [Lachnospiraceae bacterium]
MERSKVYFTDFRTKYDVPLTEKLQKLIKKAGIESIDMQNKFAAIKMHFGEMGNIAYLRPNFAKAVADVVKENGGIPFLTDCNTLYPGSRKNALEHMDCANINGFNTITTGCQIIIGDGLKGTDDIEVPVENGVYCKSALIGRAIMDADVFISLAHFKGHEVAGFGGAIKNIGMGCGSRAGKMQQHDGGSPKILKVKCRGCRKCISACGSDAIYYNEGKASIDSEKCKGCGRCIGVCGFDAIVNTAWNANQLLGCKMAEYTKAVTDAMPSFHINIIMDVSPNCDCHGENDAPVIPDVGMLASFDPVALDQASTDLCCAQTPIENSNFGDALKRQKDSGEEKRDMWRTISPGSAWKETLEHAQKIGLGTREYELIRV